ncbi:MAG: hypothetical protein AB1348_09695 [Nitrospirota bacterium]
MKKLYRKPEIKEVKLVIEDALLTACRSSVTSTINSRVSRACNRCRTTYRVN